MSKVVPSVEKALVDELRGIVGERNVLTDPDVVAGYTVDWTGRFRGATPAVVRPHDVEQVAAVLRACTRAEVAVVPQGGNTGLVGGSVPLSGEIVCSLRALDDLGPVDDGAAQATWPRATPRRSVAWSRRTPAACTYCATARRDVRWWGCKRCSPTVR
jgi:hypothetical protein